MTHAGMVIGTGPYMAPEVREGKKFDGRADQYALAATVYEALAGRVPFDGATLPAIIMQQLSGKIPPLHALAPKLPKTLTQVIEKGLSRDPADRYVNCAAFAKAVLAATNTIPMAAHAPAVQKTKAAPKAVCPTCRKPFALPPDPAGKKVTCPACGASFTVAKRSPDQGAAETSRSTMPRAETQVAPRNDAAPRPTAAKGMLFAELLDLPKKLSRRTWIGIAIAVGVFGLVFVTAIVSVVLLWSGKAGEKNRP
jgi:serine/threonine protein kinase